jgi:capsular polysaccharide biosynthesis protein
MDSEVSLAEVARRAVSRWPTFLVTVMVFALGAALLVTQWPTKYTATAVVTVSPINVLPLESAPVNIDTERAVVTSTGVAHQVAETLKTGETTADLLSDVSVTTPENSQVLRISFTAANPSAAARGANTFADAYLDSRVNRAHEIADETIHNIETRIGQILSNQASGEQRAALQQQVLALREQQNSLATIALDPGRVVGQAQPPSQPSSINPAILGAAGVLLGALIGLVLALLRDRVDPRVRSPHRLAAAVGRPVMDDTEGDFLEPFRRALFAVREELRPRGLVGADAPLVVAVESLRPVGRRHDPAAELTIVAKGSGLAARLIRAGDDAGTIIDRGWPSQAGRDEWADLGVDLIVIDTFALTSAARREMIARRSDAIVVVAHSRSRIAQVSATLQRLNAAGIDPVGVIVMTRKPPRLRHRADMPAEVRLGEPAQTPTSHAAITSSESSEHHVAGSHP